MTVIKLSLSKSDLHDYVLKQLNNVFPDNFKIDNVVFDKSLDQALQRTEYCFSKVNNKYFRKENNSIFNHLNGDQYSMFLYLLSNSLYKNECDLNICAKVFLLNKALHAIDAFYEVELPSIFVFVHPLGTVLGRGNFSDYFVVYQRCNIGSNKNIYPTLGMHVTMHPGSAILGNCNIGDNCRIAAHSLLLDKDLEPNSLYVGNPKEYFIRQNKEENSIWL